MSHVSNGPIQHTKVLLLAILKINYQRTKFDVSYAFFCFYMLSWGENEVSTFKLKTATKRQRSQEGAGDHGSETEHMICMWKVPVTVSGISSYRISVPISTPIPTSLLRKSSQSFHLHSKQVCLFIPALSSTGQVRETKMRKSI